MADGPFRYVRNPLYPGTLLVSVGIGLLASPLVWLFIDQELRPDLEAGGLSLGELRLMFVVSQGGNAAGVR